MRPNPMAPASALSSLGSRGTAYPGSLGNGQQRFPTLKPYRQQLVEVKATMHAELKASGKSRDQIADLMSQKLRLEITRSQIDKWVGTNPNDLKYEIGIVKATAWAHVMGSTALIDDNLEEIGCCSVAVIDREIARLFRIREAAAQELAALDIRRTA